MTRRAAIRALALAACVASGAAPAQSPPSPPSSARALFERGLAALEADRFAEAVMALEASSRVRAVPVVLFNLGLAYRGVGRYRDAIDAFARYLADPASDPDAARVTAIEQEIHDLRAALGALELTLVPPSASLRVDGRPRVVTGPRVSMDPGAHVLDFAAEGYLPRREELSIDPGGTLPLVVRLVREPVAPASPPEGPASDDPSAGTSGRVPGEHPGRPLWGTGAWVGASVATAAVLTATGLWIDGSITASRYDARCRTSPAAGDCRSYYASTQSDLNDRAAAVNIAWGVAALGLLIVAVDVVSGFLSDDPHPTHALSLGVGAGAGDVTVRW